MKPLHKFLYKSGNISLSGLQVAVLAAAVLVAGVAVYQLFSVPPDVNPDTVFSSQDEDDVYFIREDGPQSSGYGEGGEVQSGILTRMSRDMQLMDLDAQRRSKKTSADNLERREGAIKSFEVGGEEDGFAAQTDNERPADSKATANKAASNKPASSKAANSKTVAAQQNMPAALAPDSMAQLRAQMAAQQKRVQDMIAQQKAATAQATAQPAQSQQAVSKEGNDNTFSNVLGKESNSERWGMAAGMARASGHNLNSTPLQSSNRSGADRSGKSSK